MDFSCETLLLTLEQRFLRALEQRYQWQIAKNEIENLEFHLSQRNNTKLHIAARAGSRKMVENLLRENTPASRNSEDETPLHIAARSGHFEVVQVLIDWISSTENAENGDGTSLQILGMRNMKGNTALHEAARNGHYCAAEVLVEKLKRIGSDLLVSLNNAGESPLSMAVDAKASGIVEIILDSASDSLLHRSSDGQTLLHRAILRADFNIMKIILDKSPGVMNEQDRYGRSPLHYAAASGSLKMVYELIQRRPSHESLLDHNLATPAHMAAANGHLQALLLFVKYRLFSAELLNNHHQNILHVAAQNGHTSVVQYIVQNMFMVSDLLNETDADGNTPLHLAAANLQSSVITIIIQAGNVDTRIINSKRETALDIATNFQLVSPSHHVNEGTSLNQARSTPNKTDFAYEKEQRISVKILKAASSKQAEKLEGILEQEDRMTEPVLVNKLKEMDGTLVVMAILVATVTFTAAFTLPGGLQSGGEQQGMAVLARKTSFKAFIVTDTIAFTSSVSSSVILFTSSWIDVKNKWNLHFVALQLLWLSLVTMGIAFVTGLFSVLSNSMVLAIVVCCIGCLFPVLLYLSGYLIFPGEFVWSVKSIEENVKAKMHLFLRFYTVINMVTKEFRLIRTGDR